MITSPTDAPGFRLRHTLQGHSKAVNILSFSPDGTFLLSGGDDALLIIWDLRSGQKQQVIGVPFHGPALSAAWTYTSDGGSVTGVLIGCSNGMTHFYRQDVNSMEFSFVTMEPMSDRRSGVEAIAFDPHNSRVATASAKGEVKLWELSSDGALVELQTAESAGKTVSCVFFCEQGEQLVICYLESHEVYAPVVSVQPLFATGSSASSISLQVNTWELKWSHQLPRRIGNAIRLANGTFAVTNLTTGLDIFDFPPTQILKTYDHPIRSNVRLQVASLCNGELLVVGSDDGQPRIASRASETGFDHVLAHGTGLVQAVATMQSCSGLYIASASAEAPYDVKVWCAEKVAVGQVSARRTASASISFFQLAIIITLCCFAQALTSQISAANLAAFSGRLRGDVTRAPEPLPKSIVPVVLPELTQATEPPRTGTPRPFSKSVESVELTEATGTPRTGTPQPLSKGVEPPVFTQANTGLPATCAIGEKSDSLVRSQGYCGKI